MKTIAFCALAAVALAATPAAAKPYVDYTPQKGYWDINAVEVDPNHVDDYLTGLSKSLVPVFETLTRRGLIDQYKFMNPMGYVKGSPNALTLTHSRRSEPSTRARAHLAVEREINAAFSEAQQDAAVAGYEKYRRSSTTQWLDIDMRK